MKTPKGSCCLSICSSLIGAILLGFCSCAVAPATVKKIVRFENNTSTDTHLHQLITQATHEPPSPDSAQALGEFVERWKKRGLGPTHTLPAPTAGGVAYRIHFDGGSAGCYPLDYFDQVESAHGLKVGKIAHYRRTGVGAPLIALRENHHREAIERYFPDEAITRPLTAVATKGAVKSGIQDVEIRLLCPLVNPTVGTGRNKRQLAADFSAAWATLLSRSGELSRNGILDVVTASPKRPPQLYLMQPYDPHKEPLIMIHGLLSTPLAWAGVSNELWADDTIRQRYQIWHYLYNTSAPALYSARLLRKQIREVREVLDPRGKDPASRHITLLAHSMGGLVSKAIVTEPGDAFWKAAINVPHETLKLTPEDRRQLQDAFEWQPERTVRRIIFIAVPHRGSDFADNFLGRIGQRFAAPPLPFKTFYQRISESNPGVFTPDYAALGTGELDG
ncbi:MAG: esterase/lipase family protein, partial [Luteolibacter sp.]